MAHRRGTHAAVGSGDRTLARRLRRTALACVLTLLAAGGLAVGSRSVLLVSSGSGASRSVRLTPAVGADSSPNGVASARSSVSASSPTSSLPGGVTGAPAAEESGRTLGAIGTAARDRAQRSFTAGVGRYLADRHGVASAAALDPVSGLGVSYSAHQALHTASIVKADILAVLLLQHQDAGRWPSSSEQALAEQMITASDNAAASSLWTAIGGASGLAAANRRLGLRETSGGSGSLWGLTSTTAADQLRLLVALTNGRSVLGGRQRSYALGLMARVEADQAWGVTAVADSGTASAVKNGWLPYSGDGYAWIVNSIGRVHPEGGHTLLIAVLSKQSPDLPYGIATVEQVSRLAARAIDGTDER